MCDQDLQSQCETTQVREHGKGAALLGYTKLYGQVPGGQAELLRVPQAHYGPIKVPEGPPDERFVYLSDVLPTAWQAVEYAGDPRGRHASPSSASARSARCAARIAQHRGAGQVFGIDLVPERLALAERHGVDDARHRASSTTSRDVLRERTDGRGPDSVIDAVGMEAHGAPLGKLAQKLSGFLPDAIARPLIANAAVDRLERPARGDRQPCAAAARSRSAASTAASSTRCR